jgi:hypothetical protein
MLKLMTVTAALVLWLVFPASAVMVEGGRLQDTCGDPQEVRQAACFGYIGGIIDAMYTNGQFCLSPRVPSPEILRRVASYIVTNRREIGGNSGVTQVLLALKANWPCVDQQPIVMPPMPSLERDGRIPPYYPRGASQPSPYQTRPYFGIDAYGRPTVHWR